MLGIVKFDFLGGSDTNGRITRLRAQRKVVEKEKMPMAGKPHEDNENEVTEGCPGKRSLASS